MVAYIASCQDSHIEIVAHKTERCQFLCFRGARAVIENHSQGFVQAVIADERGGHPGAILFDPDMPYRVLGGASSLFAEDYTFISWFHYRKRQSTP